MISRRVLLFVTLAVGVLDYVRAEIWRKIPVSFYYVAGEQFDVAITLENVPPVAKYYDLLVYYQTDNYYCDAYMKRHQCSRVARNGTIPMDGPIHITQRLSKRSITLYIELRNSNKINCSTKRILDGSKDDHADKVGSEFRACLKKYNSTCEIIVDFDNKCKANTSHEGKHSQDSSQMPDARSSPEPEANRSTAPPGTPQYQRTEPSDITKYFIGIAAVVGIMILISVIFVVIKKCYRKSHDPEQILQLETYASINAVLYAELDIRPGNAPPPPSTDDPTYAKIIGVLRPQNQNDKK